MNPIRYIRDLVLECRIGRVSCCLKEALKVGDHDLCVALWVRMAALIEKRSPEQVRRMERRLGL